MVRRPCRKTNCGGVLRDEIDGARRGNAQQAGKHDRYESRETQRGQGGYSCATEERIAAGNGECNEEEEHRGTSEEVQGEVCALNEVIKDHFLLELDAACKAVPRANS